MDDKSYLELLSKLHQYRLPIYGELKEELQAKLEEFQKCLGVFQFYIYNSAMDKSGMVTLDPWMDGKVLIPWEENSFVTCSWFKNFNPPEVEDRDKKQKLIKNFHEIRNNNGLHAPDNHEFITLFTNLFNRKPNADSSVETQSYCPVSAEEIKYSILLVSDGELSLFSFLFNLSGQKNNWNLQAHNEEEWFRKFKELGFINDSSVLTQRYYRMLDWIMENSATHPSLDLLLKKDGRQVKLGILLETLLKDIDQRKQAPWEIAHLFWTALNGWQFLIDKLGWFRLLASKDIFLQIPTIRFNLLGESELRKNENISRNYFAIPMMYISNEHKGVTFSTFAVGTILDVGNLKDPGNLEKIQKLKAIMNELSRLGMDKSFYESILAQNEALTNTAIKAAISQVMARNMSHNIGSHVLSRFKEEEDISKPVLMQYTSLDDQRIENVSDTLPLIATFNNYLKNRMDYLADIATSDPVMENLMSFKSGLMMGIDANRALLDRISGVTDPDLKFKFILTRRGEPNQVNVSISITNDILGAHAFYIILENIIRNIAKHSKLTKAEKEVRITIDISDFQIDKEFSEFYEVSIYDNICRPRFQIREIVHSRNKSFNKSILENYTLRQTDLGTIEMDVCAAYLRCLPITSIELPEYELNVNKWTGEADNAKDDGRINNPLLIYAYFQPSGPGAEQQGYLGYKLYFNRPKEVLVVDDEGTFSIGDLAHDEMKQKGVRVIKSGDILPGSIFNYHFLYCHSELDEKKLQYRNIPRRILSRIQTDSFPSPDSLRAQLWQRYICTKFPQTFPVTISKSSRNLTIGRDKNNKYKIEKTDAPVSTIFIDNHSFYYDRSDKFSYYDMECSHHKLKDYSAFLPAIESEFYRDTAVIRLSEYLEIVNTSIVVIDERIQESISNQSKHVEGKILLYNYFKKQKVFIPTDTDADLNELSFGEMGETGTVAHNLKNYIHSPGKKEADFFVIHLGVIEKLLPGNVDKSEKEITKIIDGLFEGIDLRKIVVTSGRGCPNNLPKNIVFVPIALIQNAIEASFDKILLTKILYNSRTPKIDSNE
jgi:hypothetical protein